MPDPKRPQCPKCGSTRVALTSIQSDDDDTFNMPVPQYLQCRACGHQWDRRIVSCRDAQ